MQAYSEVSDSLYSTIENSGLSTISFIAYPSHVLVFTALSMAPDLHDFSVLQPLNKSGASHASYRHHAGHSNKMRSHFNG
jgi:hypothetical protein